MSQQSAKFASQFAELFEKVSSERFLAKTSVSNEVPFFVWPYAPHQHHAVQDGIITLTRRLEGAGVPVLTLPLYEVCMDFFEEDELVSDIADLEKSGDYEALHEAVRSVLDWDLVLRPRLEARFAERPNARVTFVTQIGQVYPYLRSGELLNRMQVIATDTPTVFFYPGTYDQKAISLFGELPSEKYYRAFNLNDYRV